METQQHIVQQWVAHGELFEYRVTWLMRYCAEMTVMLMHAPELRHCLDCLLWFLLCLLGWPFGCHNGRHRNLCWLLHLVDCLLLGRRSAIGTCRGSTWGCRWFVFALWGFLGVIDVLSHGKVTVRHKVAALSGLWTSLV
jgi:hypothetical protein